MDKPTLPPSALRRASAYTVRHFVTSPCCRTVTVSSITIPTSTSRSPRVVSSRIMIATIDSRRSRSNATLLMVMVLRLDICQLLSGGARVASIL